MDPYGKGMGKFLLPKSKPVSKAGELTPSKLFSNPGMERINVEDSSIAYGPLDISTAWR